MEEKRRLTLEEIQERHPELIAALRDTPYRLAARALPPARRALSSVGGTRYLARRPDRRPGSARPLLADAAHISCGPTASHVAVIMVGSFYDPVLESGCAFEELICFHGGLGGPQTRPFILYPASP